MSAPPDLEPGLSDVVGIAGTSVEIYSYLQPRELCRLSLACRVLLDGVLGVRREVLRGHLPIELVDETTKDTVSLAEGHSYEDEAGLQEFMVRRFDAAGILVRDTRDRRRSVERARHLLRYQNWCHLTLPEHTFNALAECHIDSIDPQYANKMIDWNDCRGVMEQNAERHKFVMDWARYLLAQPDAESRRWNWISNHPNFRHQSVRGTGIMISTPGGGERIEVRWDKKFKLKGSIFDSNLHRRQQVR